MSWFTFFISCMYSVKVNDISVKLNVTVHRCEDDLEVLHRPILKGSLTLYCSTRPSTNKFEFEFISVSRHLQRYFSQISDGTDAQVDWRRSWTYGRAPNAIDIS